MATVPLSGTNIRLLSGIPFSSDSKHTRWFSSIDAQTDYFFEQMLVHSINEANFQRSHDRTFVSVPLSLDELRSVNYLMFQNTHYSSKWFYAFVTKLEYVQKKTTYVHFEIDLLQTWKFEMTFKPSFVVREHCPLWNPDGSPVLNTIDEGLNYGTDYETVSVDKYRPYNDMYFLVIVCKSLIHGEQVNEITPIYNGSPQPLSYYVHPFHMDGTTPPIMLGAEGAVLNTPLEVLKAIFKMDDAVNNVVSLYVTESIGAPIDWNSQFSEWEFPTTVFSNVTVHDIPNNLYLSTLYVKDLQTYSAMYHTYNNIYDGFEPVSESKLLMFPYTVTILDDFKGNRFVLKNEYLENRALSLLIRGSLGTSNKVSYSVLNYLKDADISAYHDEVTSGEKAVINNNPNDLPIMNDYLSAFLQGNRNQIENQKTSILFNGLMNGLGNASNLAGQMRSGNIGGSLDAAGGLVQGAGNTVLQLQAIEAKQQDINNIPPQLTKMGGNTNFDYGNNINGLFIIKKQITEEYRKKLSDFFKLYGYKINEVKIPNFHTRQSWNYVQTADCVITGNFNHEDLQELKNIFDSGITLWHTNDVGNYDLANEVIA